jgi:hypothetical protein
MKKHILLGALLFSMLSWSQAQHLGVSLSVGVRKEIKLWKNGALDLRQQIQVNPEIEKYDQEFGDFFNEESFWPIPDRYRPADDDDDDGGVVVRPPGELGDSPYDISFEWRTSSIVRLSHSFAKWMRVTSGYTLFYNGEEFRHAWQSELDYRPLQHGDTKRKFDISTRVSFQRTGRPKKDKMVWEAFLTPRLNMTWAFKKNHSLYLGGALNGAWDDGILEFDRYRITTGITYTIKKRYTFDFGYQYQQRLDKPGNSNSISLAYQIKL